MWETSLFNDKDRISQQKHHKMSDIVIMSWETYINEIKRNEKWRWGEEKLFFTRKLNHNSKSYKYK